MKTIKTIFPIVVVVAGLASCNNNHSSCPVRMVDIDSMGMVLSAIDEPQLTKEKKLKLRELSKDCAPNMVYEAVPSCHLESDTSYFLGIAWKIETWSRCDIERLQVAPSLTGSTEMGSITDPSAGYFVVFPEGDAEFCSWVAYVADSVTSGAIEKCRALFGEHHPPVFLFDKAWNFLSEIKY